MNNSVLQGTVTERTHDCNCSIYAYSASGVEELTPWSVEYFQIPNIGLGGGAGSGLATNMSPLSIPEGGHTIQINYFGRMSPSFKLRLDCSSSTEIYPPQYITLSWASGTRLIPNVDVIRIFGITTLGCNNGGQDSDTN